MEGERRLRVAFNESSDLDLLLPFFSEASRLQPGRIREGGQQGPGTGVKVVRPSSPWWPIQPDDLGVASLHGRTDSNVSARSATTGSVRSLPYVLIGADRVTDPSLLLLLHGFPTRRRQVSGSPSGQGRNLNL